MIVQVKNIIPTTKKFLECHIVEGWPGFREIGGRGVELQETEKETGEKRSDSDCRGSGGGNKIIIIRVTKVKRHCMLAKSEL